MNARAVRRLCVDEDPTPPAQAVKPEIDPQIQAAIQLLFFIVISYAFL